MAHPTIEAIGRLLDRIGQSLWLAVLLDVIDVALYGFTIAFNVIVITVSAATTCALLR